MIQRTSVRVAGLLAVVAAVAVSCTVPQPFTYPLQLTPPRDATAEVRMLAGQQPVQQAVQRAQIAANRMSGTKPGCEVFVVARVMWATAGEPARAAIESRGTCDDSVGGAWYELTLEGDDQAGWVVASATKSDVCNRGVSGTLCV